MKKILLVIVALLLTTGCDEVQVKKEESTIEPEKVVVDEVKLHADDYSYNIDTINAKYNSVYEHIANVYGNEKLIKAVNSNTLIKINFDSLTDYLDKANIQYEILDINLDNYKNYLSREYLDNNLIVLNYNFDYDKDKTVFDFKTSILTSIKNDSNETKLDFLTYILFNNDGVYNLTNKSLSLDNFFSEINKGKVISIMLNQDNLVDSKLIENIEVKDYINEKNYKIVYDFGVSHRDVKYPCQIISHFYTWNYLNPNNKIVDIYKVVKELGLVDNSLNLYEAEIVQKYKDNKYFNLKLNHDINHKNLYKHINNNELVVFSANATELSQYMRNNKKLVTNYQESIVDYFLNYKGNINHSVVIYGYEYNIDEDKLYYKVYDPSNNYICKVDEYSLSRSNNKIYYAGSQTYTYVLKEDNMIVKKY